MFADLAQAHKLRLHSKVPEARQWLVRIKASAGWPLGSPSGPQQWTQTDDHKADCQTIEAMVSLEASLLRADFKVVHAEQLLTRFEEWAIQNAYVPQAQFHFQRGLNSLQNGDYSSARNHFCVARDWFSDPEFKVAAAGNYLICQIALGNWTQPGLLEFFEYRKSAGLGLDSQCEYLILQNRFLGAELSPGDLEPQKNSVGQDNYYRDYLRGLPFFKPDSESGGPGSTLETSPHLYETGYRSRTLLGLVHPEDLRRQAVRQVADRLYLWLWKWLWTGSPALLAALLEQLRVFTQIEDDELPLTFEDCLMLQSVFTCLMILDPSSQHVIRPWLQRFQDSGVGTRSRHFDVEQLFWNWVQARYQGQDELAKGFKAQIQAISAKQSSLYRWSEWMEQDPSFVEALRPSSLTKNGVQLPQQSIRWKGTLQMSPILSRAAALIAVSAPAAVSVEVFSQRVFEESGFIEDTRVQGVLNRLRKLFGPSYSVVQKGDWILPAAKWAQIPVFGLNSPALLLQSHKAWRNLVADWMETPRTELSEWEQALKRLPQKFTRQDLMKTTGRSKATLCRWLESAQKRGEICALGRGKATEYTKQGTQTK
jgi:hypothetical protein